MSVTKPNSAQRTNWLRLDKEQLWLDCRRLTHRVQLLRQWWLKPHTPFQPFFTMATARSGSNLLVDFINHLPGAQSLSEVLCNDVPEGPRKLRMKPAKALRHIRYSLQTIDTPARGCKLMLYQLARCGLTLDSLEGAFCKPKYIVLYRQSLAEQYVSLQAAMVTNQWAVFRGEQPKQPLIQIDPEEFRRYSERIQQGYRELLAHPVIAKRGILLSYEELTQNPAGCLRQRICPHLGVPAAAPMSILCKQSSKPLAERVANYSAVADLLQGPLGRQQYAFPAQCVASRRAA